MTVTYTVDQFTPQQWGEACRSFPDYSIYQTWGFGEISAGDTGSQLSRIVVRDADAVIGAAQVRIKKLPLIRAGLAYVYFGPLGSRSVASIEDFAEVLRCVREEYAERRGLEVRLVPNLWERHSEDLQRRVLRNSGFSASRIRPPYRTIIVDLSPTLDELRANLAQKWRNGLNQSEKRGVTVESGVDDEAMQQFEQLYDAMWTKKQFETGVTVSSFRRLQQLLPAEEKLIIHLAYKDDMLAAGHVSSTLGDTCLYLLGASNDLGRDCKASYTLQWHALSAAKNAGTRRFDLGGIDPNDNPGVYHFKAGLGGLDTSYVGRFEARARGIGRYIVPMAERIHRTMSPLSKKQKRVIWREAPSETTKVKSDIPCRTTAKSSS